MKETTKMSRAVCQLEKMFNVLNMDKFGGTLPTPIITVQSKPGSMGHCTVSKVWKKKDDEQYELNIAAEVLNYPIEETLDTMLHEMVHLFNLENGIQDVSRGGKYHNGKFKAKAEEVGLTCYKMGQYGWNTKPNDSLIEYALSKDWSEIKINRGTFNPIRIGVSGIEGSKDGNRDGKEDGGKKPSSTRKYQCPNCKCSCRATKELNLICGDCMVKMEKVEK